LTLAVPARSGGPQEAAQAALALPEHQELARAYRASDYASTPPIIETFEVVQQL
jgi:hypothetical protein